MLCNCFGVNALSEAIGGIKLQLCVDHLKCVSSNSDALLDATRMSNQYILAVGQFAAPTECVLVSTCASRMMKSWVISGEDDQWKVESDVRDLGGHPDTTLRCQAGTIAGRIWKEIVQVAAIGALPMGFEVKLQILRTKSGSQASPISNTAMHTGAVLSLLDGPKCCAPAIQVIWARFRMIRRYLAFRPEGNP